MAQHRSTFAGRWLLGEHALDGIAGEVREGEAGHGAPPDLGEELTRIAPVRVGGEG